MDLASIKLIYFKSTAFDIKRIPNVTKVLVNGEVFTGKYLFKIRKYTMLSELNTQVVSLYDLVDDSFLNTDIDDLYSKFSSEYTNLQKEDLEVLVASLKGLDPDQEYHQRWEKIYSESSVSAPEPLIDLGIDLGDTHFNSITIEHKMSDILDNKYLFIKLQDIFYNINLDNSIPLVALEKKGDNPVVKILDTSNLDIGLGKKEMIQWVVTEKLETITRNRIKVYKNIKGLMFKVLIFDDNYVTLVLKQNGFIQVTIQKIKLPIHEILRVVNGYINDTFIPMINSMIPFTLTPVSLTLDNIESMIPLLIGKYIDIETFTTVLSKDAIKTTIAKSMDRSTPGLISGKIIKYDEDVLFNIEDNKYDQDTSVIKLFGVVSMNQINIILQDIYALNKSSKITRNPNPVKVNKLKEIGNARKCQHKPSFTSIPTSQEPPNSNQIDHKQKRYTCDQEPMYNFVGFTRQGHVCCYKNDQKNKEQYILNTDPKLLDITLHPSNYMLEINGSRRNIFNLVSRLDYSRPNKFKYCYLENSGIVPITEPEDIATIKNAESRAPRGTSMWLPPMVLSNLLNLGTCPSGKFFGYTSGSRPECFLNRPKVYANVRVPDFKIDKILKNELIDKQLGELPSIFNGLFKKEIVRMGILQSNSFISAVGVGNEKNNHYALFKLKLLKYINDNNIVTDKFKTKRDLLLYLINCFNNYTEVYWKDVVYILEDMYQCNVVIINASFNFKIVCKNNNRYAKYVILLKTEDFFELIVDISNGLKTYFTRDDPIVEFLNGYSDSSCVTAFNYPENYPYTRPYMVSAVANLAEYKVISDEKIVYLMTSENFLIPVFPVLDDKSLNLKGVALQTVLDDSLIDLDTFKVLLAKFNEAVSEPLRILEVIDTETMYMGGIITNTSIIIPCKLSGRLNTSKIYYPFVTRSDTDPDPGAPSKLQKDIDNIKRVISDYISSKDKQVVIDGIQAIVTSTRYSRMFKILKLVELFEELKTMMDYPQDYTTFLLKSVSNEILNYTIYNLINKTRNVSSNTVFLHNVVDINTWLRYTDDETIL